MKTTYRIGARVEFITEKQSESYSSYGEVSIARENTAIAQEAFQCKELCSLAGKAGL